MKLNKLLILCILTSFILSTFIQKAMAQDPCLHRIATKLNQNTKLRAKLHPSIINKAKNNIICFTFKKGKVYDFRTDPRKQNHFEILDPIENTVSARLETKLTKIIKGHNKLVIEKKFFGKFISIRKCFNFDENNLYTIVDVNGSGVKLYDPNSETYLWFFINEVDVFNSKNEILCPEKYVKDKEPSQNT